MLVTSLWINENKKNFIYITSKIVYIMQPKSISDKRNKGQCYKKQGEVSFSR